LKQGLDEVFEFLREELFLTLFVLAVSSPENISSVGSNTSVEWVLRLGGSEWWMLSNHDEKDDGSCEKINRLTFVGLIQMDLWGHVIQSSKFSGQIA
jgi:hypothetical protein